MASSINLTYNNGIITTPNHHKYEPDPRGVGYTFFANLNKYATKTLQIDGFTGEEETYGSVLKRSIRIALKLLEFELSPNDIILFCMSNHINSCVPIFASLFIGVKLVCFDRMMQDKEAVVLMKQIDPKIIFVDLESLSFIESTLKLSDKTATIIVLGETSNYLNFFDMLSPSPDEHEFTPVKVDEDQTAFIFFTSGSTGLPKGVCLSHNAFLGQIAVALDLNIPYDRIWDTSSLYWDVCIFYWTVSIITGGCKILIPSLDDMELVWKSISTYKPTYMFAAPFELRKMWKLKPADLCVDSVRIVDISGVTMPHHELIKYKQFFSKANVALAYGTTEGGLILFFPMETKKDLEFLNEKTQSTGSVLNGISYKIVDVDTEEVLGPYQKGELRIKTKNMFSEYYKCGTIEAFDSKGWFKTGDILYYDEDYYFYYVERLKEMIKYKASHISPKMIENVLLARDDISAACVIGIPHEEDDERPMAIVELNNESEIKDDFEKDICRCVEKALGDKFVLRGGIRIVDNIPLTPSGKYDLRKLRSMFKKS